MQRFVGKCSSLFVFERVQQKRKERSWKVVLAGRRNQIKRTNPGNPIKNLVNLQRKNENFSLKKEETLPVN